MDRGDDARRQARDLRAIEPLPLPRGARRVQSRPGVVREGASGGRGRGVTAVVEGVEVSTLHWIGGERVGSDRGFEDVSPIDEAPIAELARAGDREVGLAVEAARDAVPGWGGTSSNERAEILHAVADGVDRRVPELAAVETRDNGSLLPSMRNSVMPRVARNFRFFADQLLSMPEAGHPYNEF